MRALPDFDKNSQAQLPLRTVGIAFHRVPNFPPTTTEIIQSPASHLHPPSDRNISSGGCVTTPRLAISPVTTVSADTNASATNSGTTASE